MQKSMGKEKITSMEVQKIKAYVNFLQKSEGFWNSLIIFFAALFFLSAIPFYPLYLVIIIALLLALIGLKNPIGATALTMVLGIPNFAYQSPPLAYVFILFFALSLFEIFEKWKIINFVLIIVFAPFAPYPLSLLGWFTILIMAISAYHFGSKKSIFISIPSIYLILLLSSLWVIENNAYLPINLAGYSKMAEVQVEKPYLDIFDIPQALSESIASLFDFHNVALLQDAFGKVFENTMHLFFSDSGLFQLIVWAAVLYAMSYLSGRIRHRYAQTISSLVLLFIPISYSLIIPLVGGDFSDLIYLMSFFSIGVIAVADHFGIKISREYEMERAEKMKAYGKFGFKDLSAMKGESLEDIGDYEDVKKELMDAIVLPLEQKELAYTYNIKPAKGILLFGPPGTGKTMLMRALARKLRYGFYYIKTSDILSQWYGETEKNISEIFSNARKEAPCILFFDEIDAIGKKRTMYSSDDVSPRALSVLLQEMDGLKTGKPVIVIGATNVPHQLDPALMRPGRFDKIIYMPLPNKEARKAIFKVYLRKIPVADDIDLDRLAEKTERFSGADIKNLVNEALKLAAKEAKEKKKIVPLRMEHLMSVLEGIRPSTSLALLEEYEKFRLDYERRTGGIKKVKKKRKKGVKWEDVAGLEDVKQELLDAIQLPLLHEDLLKEYNVRPSKGILLFGPPGTGKTLIVKAAANELDAAFINISGAELMKAGYSMAVGKLKEAFNRARENPPSIIFIDEIDTIAASRSFASSDILGQLLTEMDGLKSLKQVVVVAATNKPQLLDPAILRPGRFDRIFYIPPPNKEVRIKIFEIHLGKFSKGLDLNRFAELTEGFSGADIADICRRAKMYLLKKRLKGEEAKLTNEYMIRLIKRRRPSITEEMLMEYEEFLRKYGERR